MNYNDLGYNLGLVHFYFAKYLNDFYRDKKILCNGRDCYITYRILKEIFNNENVEYIYTSRKALFNTAWNTSVDVDAEENKFIYESVIFGRYKNVFELLKYLGLADVDYLSYDIKQKVYDSGFKSLYDDIRPFQENHSEIQDKIKTLVKSLQLYLYTSMKYHHTIEAKKYLEDKVKNGDIFVDIGWNGTTQYFLENLLDIKLSGVYFETFDGVIKLPKEIDKDKFAKTFNNTCRGSQGLLEGCLFIAPHGSVKYYKGGKPYLGYVNKIDKNIREDIIAGVIERCERHKNLEIISDPFEYIYYAGKIVERFMTLPTLEEVELINTINHDNCGYSYSIVNFNKKYDEIDYKRSFWKNGYNKLS